MRPATRTTALCLTATLLGCARPSPPPLADPQVEHARRDSLAGCWRVTYGHNALIVRLDTSSRSQLGYYGMPLVVDTPLMSRDTRSWWGLTKPAGAWLLWGNGFTGLDLRMSVQGDTMRGRAYPFTDVHPALPISFSVRATHTVCPPELALLPN
jgi:hypothetical protein